MQEIDWFAEISKYLGIVVAAGGGGAAVVFGVFQAWGKGWLDSHFNKRLEEFKHEQTKEIERIKANLNTTFDRVQRLHIYEFEALPIIWNTCSTAYFSTQAYCRATTILNTQRMAGQPPKAIQKIRENSSSEIHNYVINTKKYSIFIDASLNDDLDKLATMMNRAFDEEDLNWKNTNTLDKDIKILEKQGRTLLNSIEFKIKASLQPYKN